MTNADFNKNMVVWGDCFYEDTCPNMQAEIVRKIMNHKTLCDFEKITLLNQYTKNLITNEFIVENLKKANEIK